MRILIISPMPPIVGGISVANSRLVEKLKEDGYDVTIFAQNYNSAKYNYLWLRVLKELTLPFFLLTHKRFDIVHAHVSGTPRRIFISIIKLLCMKNAKLIFTIHGAINREKINKYWMWAANKADGIICVQNGDSHNMPSVKLQKKSIDIPAFIMSKEVSENRIPKFILSFCRRSDNIPLIIFNGGIQIKGKFYDLYGFNDVINVYMKLKKERIKIRVLMINSEVRMNNDQKKFVNNIKEKIKGDSDFLFVQDMIFPLVPLFKYAKIYLRPTKTDGDSLSVREALCMGCKVIASNIANRPNECIKYNTEDDMYNKIIQTLNNNDSLPIQHSNYYEQIVSYYKNI